MPDTSSTSSFLRKAADGIVGRPPDEVQSNYRKYGFAGKLPRAIMTTLLLAFAVQMATPAQAAEKASTAPTAQVTEASKYSKKASSIPSFIAQKHIPNGCYIDAEVYMNKLAQTDPQLKTHWLPIVTQGGEPHAVVIITTPAGDNFIRDEYFGVVPAGKLDAKSVSESLEEGCRLKMFHGMKGPKRIAVNSVNDEKDFVATAAQMIPGSEVYSVGKETVLYFRPSCGGEALYEPNKGTLYTPEVHPALGFVKAAAQVFGLKGEVKAPAHTVASAAIADGESLSMHALPPPSAPSAPAATTVAVDI